MTPDEARVIISENLHRILEERGWSAYKLISEMPKDTPPNTIYRIVRGENEPGVALLATIAATLGVTVDELVTRRKKSKILS